MRDLSFRKYFSYDNEFVKFKGGGRCDCVNLLLCNLCTIL